MDANRTAVEDSTPFAGRNGRRRRWETNSECIRYFLAKAGTSAEKPELGQEITTEAEVLVQAFKSGEVFYTLVAWRAVPEINGDEPKIVKQVLSRE